VVKKVVEIQNDYIPKARTHRRKTTSEIPAFKSLAGEPISEKSDTKIYEGYFQSESNFGGLKPDDQDEDSTSQKISLNFQPLAQRERIDSGSSFKDQLLGALFGGP
jgi:hypothetical protein